MSASFTELGLSEQLSGNAAAVGYDVPTELQRAAIPVLRRGNNAVLTAHTGAGATAAYALALLDRFNAAEEPRALILAPTAERAHQIARTVGQLASGSTTGVATLGEGWRKPESAAILVATPARVQQAMAGSELTFDNIEAVVVDQADSMQALGGGRVLSEVFEALPREGQRIFVGGSFTGELENLIDSHARKALHFPVRAAVPPAPQEREEPTATIRYAVAQQGGKLEVLSRLVGNQREAVRVLCRSQRGVEEVRKEISMRGFQVDVNTFAMADGPSNGRTYAYDVPGSAEQMALLQEGDVVICTPGEIAHVRAIGATANVEIMPMRDRTKGDEALESFRAEIRRAAREEDLSAQLLVLQPLFDEYSPAEIAAALSGMLRARRPAESKASAGAASPNKTWSRLFISIGERDGVTARDMVGAITGEAGIKGDDVGKIDVRDTFSVAEVASTAAEKVIRALNGTTMKGRSLRVDHDRKSAGRSDRPDRGDRQPRSSGGDRGGPPRGGPRGPRRDGPSNRGGQRGDRPPSRGDGPPRGKGTRPPPRSPR